MRTCSAGPVDRNVDMDIEKGRVTEETFGKTAMIKRGRPYNILLYIRA